MIVIPKQLRGWRFVLLKPRGKEPIEENWQSTANYEFDDEKLRAHLESGGNYGVLLGRYKGGDHVVVDADDPALETLVKEKLPPTFTVRSGNGLHFYYVIPDADKTTD